MQQLAPKSVSLFFLKFMGYTILFVFPAIAMLINLFAVSSGATADSVLTTANLMFYVVFPIFAYFGLLYLWAKLTYIHYKYELRHDCFRKEHGVIAKKYVSIPYDRVQNVDIYRGIIARILNLSDLHIQTAGGITTSSYGGYSEGRLPGLLPEEAERLRDELIKRSRHSRGQGL